jgi:hypothetical protein
MLNKLLSTSLILLLLSSCYNYSALQSGKTLGKDNVEYSISGTYGNYYRLNKFDDNLFNLKPTFGIRAQIGIKEKLDLGFQIDQSSFIGGNIKKQFIGNQTSIFAGSIAFGTGFNVGASLLGVLKYYTTLPLYFSYHPTSKFGIYLSPRFIYSSDVVYASQSNEKIGIRNQSHLFGFSYGVSYGETHKVLFELSHFDINLTNPTQFSIGYAYRF